jgi:rubrerythrin
MAEYIEREARLREIDKAFEEYGQNGDILKLFSECRASILFAPTADVVEVRHGKWYKGDMPTYGGYKCSVCELNTVEYNKPYCPNCGAKMDGKGEGE